jgi:hypothetical protein
MIKRSAMVDRKVTWSMKQECEREVGEIVRNRRVRGELGKSRNITGDDPHKLHFYIADMGPDDLVLGYPWFAATNVQPNWTEGTLPTSVTIRTRGAASGKPMPSLKIARVRTSVQRPSFLEEGDELHI